MLWGSMGNMTLFWSKFSSLLVSLTFIIIPILLVSLAMFYTLHSFFRLHTHILHLTFRPIQSSRLILNLDDLAHSHPLGPILILLPPLRSPLYLLLNLPFLNLNSTKYPPPASPSEHIGPHSPLKR